MGLYKETNMLYLASDLYCIQYYTVRHEILAGGGFAIFAFFPKIGKL